MSREKYVKNAHLYQNRTSEERQIAGQVVSAARNRTGINSLTICAAWNQVFEESGESEANAVIGQADDARLNELCGIWVRANPGFFD